MKKLDMRLSIGTSCRLPSSHLAKPERRVCPEWVQFKIVARDTSQEDHQHDQTAPLKPTLNKSKCSAYRATAVTE
jgi:hypothetical protein